MTPRLGIRLDARQKRDWLRLSRCEGVGPRAFKSLINKYGGAGAALEALPRLAQERGRSVAMPTIAEIEAEIRAAERFGVIFLASGEDGYPESLLTIDGPPPVLAVKGRLELLEKVGVGIVGARNASASGRRMASLLARGLGEAGFCVVSGLARGVDAEAHRMALESGTIAVLAGGLDKPYPPENAGLAEEIAEKGVIVSEMPLGLSPRGRDFPRRNRLIAGLSAGVVIVEAARRSGSLITARMAGEQGRQVFAVPGSPLDPRCEGSNDLLREGVSIACSAEDIINALRPMAGSLERPLALFREEAAFDDVFEDEAGDDSGNGLAISQQIYALLSLDPVEIDTLVRMSRVSASVVQGALMELELEGLIRRDPGSRVSRLP